MHSRLLNLFVLLPLAAGVSQEETGLKTFKAPFRFDEIQSIEILNRFNNKKSTTIDPKYFPSIFSGLQNLCEPKMSPLPLMSKL